MPNYNFDGAAINQLAIEIERQLTTYFGFDSADLEVSRNNQPTQQHAGAEDNSPRYQIFITKVSAGVRVGGGFKDIYNDSTNLNDRNYTHIVPGVYQVDVLAAPIQSETDPSDADYEANDLSQLLSNMINQMDFITSMRNLGIYIEKAGESRPSYIVNDSELYEMNPSFDINLHYNSEYVKALPRVASIDGITRQV